MQFNLKFMREFFKFFHKTDTGVEENNDTNFKSLPVGMVHVLTPQGLTKIPLHITQDERQTLNTAWVVELVDGRIMILFHLDCFMESLDTPEMNGLYATVAHEVGHYLAGHFGGKANKNLDIKTEDQEFLIKQYHANPSTENEMRYMRCLFFSLLRGAVNIAELEADLIALKFVPLAELVHIHTLDFKDEKNPFTVVEKVNRIKRLNAIVGQKKIDTQGYSLFIHLYDMNKPKEEREKEEPAELLAE